MKKTWLALVFLISSLSCLSWAELIGPHQDRILRAIPTDSSRGAIHVQDCAYYSPKKIEKTLSGNTCQYLMKQIPLCWIENHFKKLNYDPSRGEELMAEYRRLQGTGGSVVGATAVGTAANAVAAPIGLFGLLFIDFKISKVAKQIFSEVPPLHVLLMTGLNERVYFVDYADFRRQLMDSLWTLYEDKESLKACRP